MDGVAAELKGKFVIVYDFKDSEGTVNQQALFFGYDSGAPAVLHDAAKVFDEYHEAVEKLPLAVRMGRKEGLDYRDPYIVEIPA